MAPDKINDNPVVLLESPSSILPSMGRIEGPFLPVILAGA